MLAHGKIAITGAEREDMLALADRGQAGGRPGSRALAAYPQAA